MFHLFVSGPARPAHNVFVQLPGRFMLCHGNRPLKDERGSLGVAPWLCIWLLMAGKISTEDDMDELAVFDLPDKRFLCFFALAIVFQFFLFHSLMPGITLKVESSIMYSKITSIDACIGMWF